jgi:hypothetical protein
MTHTTIGSEVTAGGELRPVSPTYPLPVSLIEPTGGSGGLTLFSDPALLATKAVVAAVPASIYGYHIHNPNAAIAYVQVFNKLTAGVTVGTTVPDWVIGIPANGTVNLSPGTAGIDFSTGVVIAATTTTGGLTALGAGLQVGIFYK